MTGTGGSMGGSGKRYAGMDKAIDTVGEDGQAYFHIGKTRIKITEHFPEKGRTVGELVEELILHAARRDQRADDIHICVGGSF